MFHFGSGSGCRPRLAVVLVVLTVFVAVRPAQARQVLFVANYNSNTVGKYNAVTGAAINAAFINGQGLSGPSALTMDGNNHLLVVSSIDSSYHSPDAVGQYDATTGATINPTFLNVGYLTTGLKGDTGNHLFASSLYGVVQYDATSGATINPNFIQFNNVAEVVADGNNHVLVPFYGNGTVGEYNATTGAAINTALVAGLSYPERVALDRSNHLFLTYGGNGSNNTVGEYDANSGVTINGVLISAPGPILAIAVDGSNHLFMASLNSNSVAEYDATTGFVINPDFITGLNGPRDLIFVAPIPEPSSLLLVAVTAVAGIYRCRRALFR